MNLMQPFTFIHAADLHLDAVLPSPSGEANPALRKILDSAVLTALGRLVELCISERAAFLILAGDVFHNGSGSLKSGGELADAFKKLGDNGVEVFWARGNHDSLSQSDDARAWPENVHIFSKDGERIKAANGVELHGISHFSQHERASLVEKLAGAGSGFGIGVLHCAVNGAQGAHISYAPCALSELSGSGKDYWALGHVHGSAVLAENPPIIYPGSLQGLHINEPGPHGCYVVKVGAGGKPKARFAPLAPVRWERLPLDASGFEHLDELEDAIIDALCALCADLRKEQTGLDLLLARLELTGRSPLDALLRKADNLGGLVERVNSALAGRGGSADLPVRLKDAQLYTSPDIDITALKKSDNLVGEALRRSDDVAARLDELAASGVSGLDDIRGALAAAPWGEEFMAALDELYGNRRAQEAELVPSADELAEMAREAAALCLHLFEVEE